MSNQPIPPAAPAPKSGTSTILIVVVAVVAVCCLCTALTGAGGAALFMFNRPVQSGMMPTPETMQQIVTVQVTPLEEATATEETSTPVEDTPEPTETAEPEDTATPEPTETAEAPTASGPGMGVSRDEMMHFFNAGNAFTWADPIKVSGVEMVQGTHSSLCVKSDCAVVTLAGPADELLAVSLAVPLSTTDSNERLTAITLLMTAVSKFNDQKGLNTYPKQILNDIESAAQSGTTMEKSFLNNGYQFSENYNPKTHVAAVGIARPK